MSRSVPWNPVLSKKSDDVVANDRAARCIRRKIVRSIKDECVNRMVFFGEASLRYALSQFMAHYHHERNHQGVGNHLLRHSETAYLPGKPVKRRQRLGGMLSFYLGQAA
jgi:putative transposase